MLFKSYVPVIKCATRGWHKWLLQCFCIPWTYFLIANDYWTIISFLFATVPVSMKELLDIAWEHRAKWRFIGIELQIDTGTLDAIAADNHHQVGDCLTRLISLWLHQINPRLARRAITKAIKSETVTGSDSLINKGKLLVWWLLLARLMYTCNSIMHVVVMLGSWGRRKESLVLSH